VIKFGRARPPNSASTIRGRHPDMSRRRGARARAATKIAFDRVGSAVALLWLWPILAGIAVGIRLTMGSPVLFRQVRAGRDGAPFTILKFRTMEMRAASCCGRPETCRGIQMAPGATISRFARFVRRTGLDELPSSSTSFAAR
jgi:lipopolysaccharide/colanic/teichoic acid biosynthesis glycosyltransferase